MQNIFFSGHTIPGHILKKGRWKSSAMFSIGNQKDSEKTVSSEFACSCEPVSSDNFCRPIAVDPLASAHFAQVDRAEVSDTSRNLQREYCQTV